MVKDNKLYISEIFKSIDGEGFHAGQATVFVRLFGCNLRCPWCFGIVPGRKEPVFRRSYLHPGEKGQNIIKLSEIKVGDWILTYDEDLNVVETQVQETLTREVSEWQKVVVDNVPYFVTGNHIFFTTRGEVAAKDLVSGDIILDVKPGTLNGKTVQSNERIFDPEHPLTVYNVSCTPYNTYFIDNMWVHNCDTKTTWTGEAHKRVYGHRPTWMTVDEIVTQVEELEQGWPYKSICLTGGEPLMEENKELVEQLIEDLISKGYGVNIETNGAIDYKYWLDMHVFPSLVDVYGNRTGMSLITDWKLPSSKMNDKMIQSNLKILRECDLIKCVISDDPEDWIAFEEQVCRSGTKAKIYLSPCFGKVTMSKIPEFIIAHPEYNVTAQLQQHKIFWNPNKVGV